MDRELIRQREAFTKRALAQPTVEKRKLKTRDDSDEQAAKKHKSSSKPKDPRTSASSTTFDYKTSSGSSQYKFGILANIVKFMKTRHQNGDMYPLALDEILDETNQLDIGNKNKHWLATEALQSNPKVKVVYEDGTEKFLFKPKYEIPNRKALLNLLKRHDLHGDGGVLLEDVEESCPNVQKALKILGDNILFITRPNDKKQILYYNDKYCQFNIDEEFQKLWRGVSVEGQDERKIEEYLDKQGITSMQDVGIKKVAPVKKKRKGHVKRNFKKLNEHLDGVLEDYSELTAKKT